MFSTAGLTVVKRRGWLDPKDVEFLFLFERSEFLIDTSQKKNLCVCASNLGFKGVVKTLLLSHATTVCYEVRTIEGYIPN